MLEAVSGDKDDEAEDKEEAVSSVRLTLEDNNRIPHVGDDWLVLYDPDSEMSKNIEDGTLVKIKFSARPTIRELEFKDFNTLRQMKQPL